MDLELVCNDENGPTRWYFDASAQMYVRKNIVGEIVAVIKGEYLPDPEKLWDNKCLKAGTTIGQPAGMALKPQKAVYDLWTHWKGLGN